MSKTLNYIWVAQTQIPFSFPNFRFRRFRFRFDENIDICVNRLFENINTFEGFTKSQLKQLLYLATKESYYIFNSLIYKQTGGKTNESHLGLSFANTFPSYYEKNCLSNWAWDFKQVLYRSYLDDIFLLFKSNDHLC